MGANQSLGDVTSHDQEWTGRNFQTTTEPRISGNYYYQRVLEKQKKSKAKPGPPCRLRILNTTHNSITLTWQAPLLMEAHRIIAYTVEIANVSPGRDGLWKLLTSSCQGTTYDARHLESDSDYMFRVKAENIYGIGKPSLPSEICTTKMFEMSDDLRTIAAPLSFRRYPDDSAQSTKRHRSFNMHLGGGVKSILNHSDIFLESSTVSSHLSDKSQKSHTFLRDNIHRTSLPSSRKISAPSLLPGTRNNSLSRLRESGNGLKRCVLDAKLKTCNRDSGISGLRGSVTVFESSALGIDISTEDCQTKTQELQSVFLINSSEMFTHSTDGDSGKGSKNSLCDSGKLSDNLSISDSSATDIVSDTKSVTTSSSSVAKNKSDNIVLDNVNEKIDNISRMTETMKALDLCDEKPKLCDSCDKGSQFTENMFSAADSQSGYYNSLENPWERNLSISCVSEQILAAPLSDDVKMALYTKSFPEQQRFRSEYCHSLTGPNLGEPTNFRTLRSVLKSTNMIVKTTQSLPDVVDVVMVNGEARTLTKGKLTTIVDTDEGVDAVRVTTL